MSLYARRLTGRIGMEKDNTLMDEKSLVKTIIGNSVAITRKSRNLTQEKLAEQLGCTREHLSQIETGKKLANIIELSKICETCNIDEGFLFDSIRRVLKQEELEDTYSQDEPENVTVSVRAIRMAMKYMEEAYHILQNELITEKVQKPKDNGNLWDIFK